MAYYILKSYKLTLDPLVIFEILERENNCFFLDSSLSPHTLGRFSFLGMDPFFIHRSEKRDPFATLRGLLEPYRLAVSGSDIPFLGGAVGYLTYDLGFALERKVVQRPKMAAGLPDCFFGFYNTVLIIDHLKRRLSICAVGFPEKRYSLAKLLIKSNIRKVTRLLSKVKPKARNKLTRRNGYPAQPESSSSQKDYCKAVSKAKEYIKKGDIYQVNLSQEIKVRNHAPSFELYKRLRNISPSCFSAYLDAGDFQILSSSPERFLKLVGQTVMTRPMKGTRRRGQDRIRDQRLKKELLESAKDRAELMMIVDLERNDLGKVCDYDSVKVDTLRELEEYNTVFQTTATVSGRIHKDKDRFDALRACFPGGSITGCPKIRAMEIIEELEPHRRCVYTGCLGYLSFSGAMDFNILIRTILKKDDELSFGVGGGIVADSQPEAEYEETLVKAQAMMQAITTA